MSELHKFMFDGLPVRGSLVRLTDAWQELLARRGASTAYALPVQQLLGEMAAAAVLMQSGIKFDGALVLQIAGDGPVTLAVVEVQSDLGLRAMASVTGTVDASASLSQMVNCQGRGRCAITLDAQSRQPGQPPYQGIVPLQDGQHCYEQVSEVLQHYMRQSEQLDTTLVLAANAELAAGLMLQRLPLGGAANLARHAQVSDDDDALARLDYQRIALLASSLKAQELLELDAHTVLHRLFWQEDLRLLDHDGKRPHFSCRCSRQRVEKMLLGLGWDEVHSVLQERGQVEVGCEFCGQQYQFDVVDVAALFKPADLRPQADAGMH